MSRALHIHGVLFLSANEAGKRFGYTSDYISRLARSGKISGERVGHQWFIDPDSLRRFKYRGDEERTLRSLKLRAERKQERALAAVTVEAKIEEKAIEPVVIRSLGNSRDRLAAMIQAGSVLGMGTVVGAFMFLSVESGSFPTPTLSYSGIADTVEQVAFALYHIDLAIPDRMSAQVIAIGTGEPVTQTTAVVSGTGVVVFEEGTVDEETVANHFSDEVSVTVDQGGGGGVIQPVFKSGKEERYRFLMVPINNAGDTSP